MMTAILLIGFGLGWLGNSYFEDHLVDHEQEDMKWEESVTGKAVEKP